MGGLVSVANLAPQASLVNPEILAIVDLLVTLDLVAKVVIADFPVSAATQASPV